MRDLSTGEPENSARPIKDSNDIKQTPKEKQKQKQKNTYHSRHGPNNASASSSSTKAA
jgi:hypothetical protein